MVEETYTGSRVQTAAFLLGWEIVKAPLALMVFWTMLVPFIDGGNYSCCYISLCVVEVSSVFISLFVGHFRCAEFLTTMSLFEEMGERSGAEIDKVVSLLI